MAPLTEEQKRDFEEAFAQRSQSRPPETLVPQLDPETVVPEPEEDSFDARDERKQSWRSMVGATLREREMFDEGINRTSLQEQKELIRPAFEGVGPQIGQIYKNAYSALQLSVLENSRFGLVSPSGTYIGPKTDEEREEWNKEIDAVSVELIDRMDEGINRVEELGPEEELNTFQESLRTSMLSLGTMGPLTISSLITRRPEPMVVGLSALTAGDSYTSGRVDGLSHRDATKYGAFDGFVEGITEILPAKFFLKLFPGAKDATGSFSKKALLFLFSEIGGEQAATYLQNLNAENFDLNKELLMIEDAYSSGQIDGEKYEELKKELVIKRHTVTLFATVITGGLQTGVAQLANANFTEDQIKEMITPKTVGYQMLTPEEQNQAQQEYLDWQEKMEAAKRSDQEKVALGLAQTGTAQSEAVQTLNELEKEKQDVLKDPDLKKDTKKLRAAVEKMDEAISKQQEKVDRIEKTRLEFEKIDGRLKRLREIQEELEYAEDAQIVSELEQEQSVLLSEIKMEGPKTAAQQPGPVEYTPFEIEEGVIGLENTPEAQNMKGKTGFFNSTVQKLYDDLIEPRTANRIVTAYNTIRQKMADSGYTSKGVVDKKAPLLLKEMQKDLRRLLRQSKSLLNKELDNSRLKNKLADGTIEETEYNQKVLKNNQAIAEANANIDKIIERAQEPIIPMRDRVEDTSNPYGEKSRFFAPKTLWKTLREKVIPSELNNFVTYTPALDNEKIRASQQEEQEGSPQPQLVSFEELPEDARISLYFYEASGGTLNPLMDPITGKPFYAMYDGFEFVNPLSGKVNVLTGQHALDKNLLPSIEMDGKTYQAMWEPGTNSAAIVSLSSDPAANPNNLTALPKTLSKEDRDEWIASYYHRHRSFLTPAGVRPTTLAELQSGPGGPIAKAKLSMRQITRMFKDFVVLQEELSKDIENGVIKIKDEVNDPSILFQGEDDVFLDPQATMDRFKQLIAKSFRGDKQAQAQLGALGQTELLEKIVAGRKRITNNSKRIIELVKLMDPEGTFYTKEKVQQLEDSVERYMGRIFGAYVFPDWKAPNRKFASPEEKAQHKAAVEQLAGIYVDQTGKSPEEMRKLAESDLDKLYKGTEQQRTEVFVRMFEIPPGDTGTISPAYLATDTGQTKFIAPQLKQKRTDIPKEVRKALGELDEPWAMAQMTAYKQEQFIAMTEYLFDVARIGNTPATRFLSRKPEGRYSTEIVIPGDVISPLNGYYTTPEMARAIKKGAGYGPISRYFEGTDWFANQPARETYLAAQAMTGWISLAYLTLSIKTQSRNFQSAMLFPLMSGNWEAYNHPKEAAAYIKEKISGMTQKEMDFIVGEGVTQSSVNIGERRALFDKMQESTDWGEFFAAVEEAEGKKVGWRQPVKKGKRLLRKFLSGAEETYVAADDIPKIMNFLGEVDSGYKIFAPRGIENLTEQQIEDRIDMISELMVQMGGRKISRSESTPAENLDLAIKKRAAFLTRRNIPNYNRLPNLVDMLRLAFMSNFAGFPTAIAVAEANILKTMMVEGNLALSKDPAVTRGLKGRLGKRAAMRGVSNIGWAARGAASTTLMNAWYAAKNASAVGIPPAVAVLLFPDALASFVSPWAANHEFLVVSDADEEGVFYVVDVSYTDGYTMVSGPGRLMLKYLTARVFMGPEAASQVWDIFVRSMVDLRGTYFDQKIMLGILQELRTGRDNETNAFLWNPQLEGWQKTKAKFDHAVAELAPKAVHEGIDLTKSIFLKGEDALDKNDLERSVLKSFPQAIGWKGMPMNAQEIMSSFKVSEFNRAFQQSENFAKNVFRKAEGGALGYDDMPAMVEAYDELQRQHLKHVRKFRYELHWKAPLLSGKSPQEIIGYIQSSERDETIRVIDRKNVFTDRKKKPLYEPTDINNFVNAYVERLLKAQKKQPDVFTNAEIRRRARFLAKRIKEESYDKWSKEPVYWTIRGAIGESKAKKESRLNDFEKTDFEEAFRLRKK
jgi:hypothetical protein